MKNLLYLAGKTKLGRSISLMGTGMVFERALLAGLIRNPTRYDPTRNASFSRDRREREHRCFGETASVGVG